NDYDSIKHELSQKRDAIAKHIVNTGKGIPTTPYINTDPEERFHHLFDYIEKAQRAYQYREAIEKETQALQKQNIYHGNNNNYYLPNGMQAQASMPPVQTNSNELRPKPLLADPTLYEKSWIPKQNNGFQSPSVVQTPPGLGNSPLTQTSSTMFQAPPSGHMAFQNNYERAKQVDQDRYTAGFRTVKPTVYNHYSMAQNTQMQMQPVHEATRLAPNYF
ncbi:hypothetical protein QZH41_011686, partial [Actinostola sp. cb2023]